MRILYITYIDMDNKKSGSSVRPNMIFDAMKASGYEVILLSGEQTLKNRNNNVRRIWKQISESKPDICYIESPVYPIMKHADRKLIKKIHDLDIPIGYFYRDFYRKFPNQFPHTVRRFGKIKDFYLDLLQKETDRVLNYCDIVYFPSLKASELFHYRDMRALPPACLPNKSEIKKNVNYTCIYVGGILNQYDGKLLLDCFNKLYNMNQRYHLILICRELEWNRFEHEFKNALWLEVHHVSGAKLKPYYQRACIGLIVPNTKMSYNEFLVSVKLFEYIGEGLPIVSVDSNAMKNIIETDRIGITCKSDADEMALTINNLMTNEKEYDEIRHQVNMVAQNKHSWSLRINSIVDDLVTYKNKKNET